MLSTLLAFPATAWFLAGSVNPNGLEIAAGFLLAAGVLSLRVDHTVGARTVTAVLAVPLGTLLLAWSRPLSWVWASLILAMLLLPTAQLDGESWMRRLPVRRLGAVAFAITALGLSSVFDSSLEGAGVHLLRDAGRALSQRLGYHGQALAAGAATPAKRGRRPKTAPESA